MKNILFTSIIAFLFLTSLTAQQFGISAEIRPRLESKHGFQTLAKTDADAANFISQRSRLNFKYNKDKVKFGLIAQNVRVWGDVSTLSSDDNAFSFHEAWAQYQATENIALKMGRQEIVYDDHRIFGNVGWAQQARSHDAFLIKYAKDKHQLDVGLALNADSQAGVDRFYANTAGYKSFQYAWYHGDFDKVGLSFLVLNTGIEYLIDEEQNLDYMQTIGPRLTYKSGSLSADIAAYFQTGKVVDSDVSSSYFGANVAYQVNESFKLGVGMELLSGKDTDDNEDEINSFAPLFGTNHKFNGWMDYFYVGNHGGSVGLMDINATVAYKKDKFYAKVVPHFFSAPAVVMFDGKEMDAGLGTEIDFTLGYKLAKGVKVSGGYSVMLATETLEVLKGGDNDENNTWGWLMFTFTPELFSYTPPVK